MRSDLHIRRDVHEAVKVFVSNLDVACIWVVGVRFLQHAPREFRQNVVRPVCVAIQSSGRCGEGLTSQYHTSIDRHPYSLRCLGIHPLSNVVHATTLNHAILKWW